MTTMMTDRTAGTPLAGERDVQVDPAVSSAEAKPGSATGGGGTRRGLRRAVADERPAAPRRRSSLVVPLALQFVALLGIAAVVYPSAANWFSTRSHGQQLATYTAQVDSLVRGDRAHALSEAIAYNAQLPAGVLRDPFSVTSTADQTEDSAQAYPQYEQTLSIAGTGVIAELSYPALGIALPVYHGTSDETLASGVGHLFGSSLPVGGASTHAVLTSHSGQLHAELFSRLPEAKLGDVFTVDVLGTTLFYRVDNIATIRPESTQDLTIIEGSDYITLVTCTPVGVNSHRLLVRGTRIEAPADQAEAVQTASATSRGAGFPWWAVSSLAMAGATAVMLFWPQLRGALCSTAQPGGQARGQSRTAAAAERRRS